MKTSIAWPLLAALFVPFAGAQERPDSQPDRPSTRVLLLTGGGYHAFDQARGLLAEAAGPGADVKLVPLPSKKVAGDQLAAVELTPGRDVVLAYTQGDRAFTEADRQKLLDFIRKGGGFVGIHCAGDSHPGWPAYDAMLGGRFQTHPPYGSVNVDVAVPTHDLMSDLPRRITFKDEFYYMKNCATDDKLVLMTGKAPDGRMRPVTWVREHGFGRVFYTILGHDRATWTHPRFKTLVRRAVRWAAPAPRPGPGGGLDLFDGRTLAGWKQTGPGSFSVVDGALVSAGGMGMLWYAERRFRDFELSLEWKVERPQANSGIFVRFPKPPASPWDAVNQGYEVQICDTAGPKHRTGSIYDFQDASTLASKPAGQWNRYVIRVLGQRYEIGVNGRTVCRFEGKRGREGYVGLQNHDPGSRVHFRNVRARLLDGK